MLRESKLSILGLECINVNRSIRALRRNIFIQWIPCDPLNVVIVLRDLTYDLAWMVTFISCEYSTRKRPRGCVPVCELSIRAMLSMLPVIKNSPSGDQARSYISEPIDRHMCFCLHVS